MTPSLDQRRRAVLLVLVLLSVLTACGGGGRGEQVPPRQRAAALSVTCPAAASCLELVSGRRAVVWPGNESGPAMLWEPGGPGAQVPALPPQYVRDAAAGRDIVLLPEPWTSRDSAGGCEAGGSGCDVRPRTQEGYRQDLRELLDGELAVGAVYALSFGATRIAAVIEVLQDQDVRVVLDSPAPPPGTDAAQVLTTRATAVDLLAERTVPCHPGCTNDLPRLAAAEHAAAYEADGMSRLALSVSAWPDRPGVGDTATLEQLANGFLLSAPADRHRRDGYFEEMCAAYRGWPTAASLRGDPLLDVLTALHEPCAADGGTWLPPVQSPGLLGCLLMSAADPVAPPSLGAAWRRFLPSVSVQVLDTAGHGPLLAQSNCDPWAALEEAAPPS